LRELQLQELTYLTAAVFDVELLKQPFNGQKIARLVGITWLPGERVGSSLAPRP